MLQNAYFLAKIGADTAENEKHFAEILPTDAAPRLRFFAAGAAGFFAREADAEKKEELVLAHPRVRAARCAAW